MATRRQRPCPVVEGQSSHPRLAVHQDQAWHPGHLLLKEWQGFSGLQLLCGCCG